MYTLCTLENLKKALFTLERVVGRQGTLPILSNILLETKNGQLQLSATNLEMGVVVIIGAKIEKEGRVTLPAKILNTFLQNLPEGQVVELRQEGSQVVVKSDRYQVKINCLDPKDFPIIPSLQSEYQLELSAQVLKKALQKVLFCVSLNESRVELTGVNINFLDSSIAVAATDSFRLGEYRISGGKSNQYSLFRERHPSILVPIQTIQEIIRVIDEIEKVEVALDENQLFFRVGEVLIVSRLIHGRFPDYQQIIPSTFKEKILFQKDQFLRALKMATSFSVFHSGEVRFTLSQKEKTLTLTTESQEIGRNDTSLDFEGEISADNTFFFNPRALLDGVSTLDGDRVTLAYNSSITPVLIRDKGDELSYLYLVMPIRK